MKNMKECLEVGQTLMFSEGSLMATAHGRGRAPPPDRQQARTASGTGWIYELF